MKTSKGKIMKLNIGPLFLLTIVFVVLKLCSVIDWSWFWVLSPVIIPVIVILLVMIGLLAYSEIKLRRGR